MELDYRLTHTAPNYGIAYEERFHKNPYRSMMWELEQEVLDGIPKEFYPSRSIRHLDFACGTGRILSHLKGQTAVSVGVDLSESMLEVARKRNSDAEIIKADITQEDVLGDRKFNLITAFRFFPNAQEILRYEVIKKLVEHLDDDGLLVFNNHLNTSSLLVFLSRLLMKKKRHGMARDEVDTLLKSVNMFVHRKYCLGIIPSTEKRLLLPRLLLAPLERLLSKVSFMSSLATNQIFVCKRR